MPPMRGQTRCRMHGGRTPVSVAAANRRLAEAVHDPMAALPVLLGEAMAHKDRFDPLDQQGSYETSLERAETFAQHFAKLRLDERMVRLSEAQAAEVWKLIEGALDAAQLSEEQTEHALSFLERALAGPAGIVARTGPNEAST